MAEERWLIAGLGNPGPQYVGNRHNVGFMAADELAARMGARLRRDRSRAQVATGRLADVPVVLAKPLTFMNLSGRPVAALRSFYKIPSDRLVVLQDGVEPPVVVVRVEPRARVDP